ncbi:MAG: M23 family metallopeptidase [Bacteroidetes bacterium]|nr:M23 family metallopeptidase [Bacteroidota bacterium]
MGLRILGFLSLVLLITATGVVIVINASGDEPPTPATLDDKQAMPFDTSSTDWNDYLWPTDASTRRTSDFAEFRATHLHAGIDVSTNNRTGYNVFASRDGWLHTAYFQPGGYGWFLVLRHHDGFHTCYAHLDRYSEKVRDAYRARLIQAGRSWGRIGFDDDTVWVRKGEVIAYTGSTGAGPPHLHFEIRDPDYNPVNPGLSPNLRPVDSLPPEIRQLMLVPLDATSSVDDSYEQRLFNPAGTDNTYRIAATPVLRGRIGIMLRAHDRAEGATDYPTPYSITLYVDDVETFSTVSNRFQDSLGFHIRIDRDHNLMRARKGEFRKLYREEGNLLETYAPHHPEAGMLSAARVGVGEKLLRIVARDLAGNTSTLQWRVMIAAPVDLAYSREGTTLTLRTSGDCASLLLEGKNSGTSDVIRQWPGEVSAMGVTADVRSYSARGVRAVTVDRFGNRFVHATWSTADPRSTAARLYPRRWFAYDQIVYVLKAAAPFFSPPAIRIRQGEREGEGVLIPVDDNEYRAVLNTWPGFSGKAHIEVRYSIGEKELVWTDELTAHHINATLGGQLRSEDSRFVMSFAPGDVHRSMLFTVECVTGSNESSYRIEPSDQPLAGRPLVSITPTPGMRRPIVLVPRPQRKYRDVFLPYSTGAIVARYPGVYTLVDDSVGPEASIAVALNSREPVRIAVRDSLSGVDWNSVVARIDDVIVPLEYDERRNVLVLPLDVYKTTGRGEFSFSVRDKAGNTTVLRRVL